MEPTDVVYCISRCYIEDYQSVIDPGLYAYVHGSIRARNLAALSQCSSYFDGAKHSIMDWRVLRQVEAFFKKNALFAQKDSCASAAKESFLEAERKCAITNLRLDYCYSQRDKLQPDLRLQLARMERYIRNVLGDFQSFLSVLPRYVKVTAGATASSSRRNSIPQLKLKMKLHATHGAESYLRALYRFFGFEPPEIVYTSSNRVELVPKNWKTDRTIACEPEGVLPLQLAFDTYAKRRLRRFGIDLSDQSRNQCLALTASVTQEWATVDFKSASDTICLAVLAWLLPPDWFAFLCAVRSSHYRGVFGEGRYHKFSSMGNGTTFTLETLIFAAACYAIGSKGFSVYGDDVIVESKLFPEYQKLTSFLGFTINEDKTYTQGSFRESCGVDAFDGVDVTPIYIRGLDGRKAIKSHLINTVAGLALPEGKLASFLCGLVREWKLPYVPYQESTISGVWIDPDNARRLGILTRSRRKSIVFRSIDEDGIVQEKRRRVGKNYIEEYKSYSPKSYARPFRFFRGYYLWFLHKLGQVNFAVPWAEARYRASDRIPKKEHDLPEASETSKATIFEHVYVRKWVAWNFPSDGLPLHLYWWSGEVTRG